MSLIVKQPEKKKPTPWALYTWTKKDENDFELRVEGSITMRVYKHADGWEMVACTAEQKTYRGTRPTLEDAAKAVDRLLYKTNPRAWTVTDARAIMPWKGDLNFEDRKS